MYSLKTTTHRQRNTSRGQALIEVMVAVSVLTIGFLGVVGLLSRALALNRVVADNYTATYLAAEGIEITKNIIDGNLLQGQAWNNGLFDGDFEVDRTSKDLASYAARPLFLDTSTNLYSYSGSQQTQFTRRIVITLLQLAMRNTRSKKGFTLIELLVAVSLFSIAISIAAGGFVRALQTQRQLIALISANSSASLAIEQMAREIRTGRNFDCVGVAGICDELVFTNSSGADVAYLLEDGALRRESGGSSRPLTPSNTEIRHLSFLLLGDANFPPRITVTMGVTARSPGVDQGVTNLQTSVSSRNF
jgi:prepilin-type N-terminal cleavage/methylation domain-containing protein